MHSCWAGCLGNEYLNTDASAQGGDGITGQMEGAPGFPRVQFQDEWGSLTADKRHTSGTVCLPPPASAQCNSLQTGQSKLNESHTQHNKATCILHVCRVSRWYAYMYIHALDTTGRSASTYECGVFTNNSLNTRQCNEGSHMTLGYTHTYMFVGVYKQDQLTPNWGV